VMDGFGLELGFVPDARQRGALVDSIGAWPPFPDTIGALRALGTARDVANNLHFRFTGEHLQVPARKIPGANHSDPHVNWRTTSL